jgi:hypothetical protein
MFRGKLGAVDRYLAQTGKLTLIESVDDIQKKIMLTHRDRTSSFSQTSNLALKSMVIILFLLSIYNSRYLMG